ncbi:class I SAM-dependent methyltransferase [Streptomyces pseudovenezuelae]|uniref:class I SAM-dependent methyltransferase n=1 Tax=Streptomyces pseudovenezuelae TaxID=67350 RepID=UPI002E80853F|nr:class I SAM-dependent methyltransferase [Streptomyces pseudovenezuelae]WUA92893.1 class I SAM-dependent methyltransferase [Streptomyces pseudovenezuelae]
MTDSSTRDFYDSLAPDYHRIFADWDASMARQAAALGALLGPGPHRVLDCSCGIGTQAIGLALAGHRVVGSDLSPVAATRAAAEATARGARLPAAAADMRRLPFVSSVFDVVVCADNSMAHLLTASDVAAALADMRRVLREGGRLLLTLRDYDELRRTRPGAAPPQVSEGSDGRVITFQLWHWHEDGERYDQEYFQLRQGGDEWAVQVRRTTSWALTRAQLTRFAGAAGFVDVRWHDPASSGFYQPVLTARAAG